MPTIKRIIIALAVRQRARKKRIEKKNTSNQTDRVWILNARSKSMNKCKWVSNQIEIEIETKSRQMIHT